MAPNPTKALANHRLPPNKTAVIIGGTNGIGAAIARLMAKLGCRWVIIVGRSEEKGKKVCDAMRSLTPTGGDQIEVEFVKGDLSTVKGQRKIVEDIEKVVGESKIDYLYMSQNGPPVGTVTLTEDGLCKNFSVQAVSRFHIAYLLIKHGYLGENASIVNVANTGQTLEDKDLDINDLSLKGLSDNGKKGFRMTIHQSRRDSCVLDGFLEEMSIRNPQYTYLHFYPGLVASERFGEGAAQFPQPIRFFFWVGSKTIASTPDDFARIPVYIALHPSASQELGVNPKETKYFNKMSPIKIGSWAGKKDNRDKLWTKLREIIGENSEE